jgi:hypothetical protein
LPELWVPYGDVETLFTVQAENLAAVVQSTDPEATVELDRLISSMKSAQSVFVCDYRPATIQLLSEALAKAEGEVTPRFYATDPRRVEAAIPELKGRVYPVTPVLPVDGGVAIPPELSSDEPKILMGAAGPDPLTGLSGARTEACLAWCPGSRSASVEARKDMEPTPFEKTDSYTVLEEASGKIPGATFVDIVPMNGKPKSIMFDAPFDAVKNGFATASMQPARGLIVGMGGRGYDDTLSSALRNVWTSLNGVRKSGSVLLVAECSEGLGSPALQRLVSSQPAHAGRKKGPGEEGIEEVYYASKLKEQYDVLLLSGLPELYSTRKLGFTTAKGSGEALARLLSKVGRTAKVNVVARASEVRVESG